MQKFIISSLFLLLFSINLLAQGKDGFAPFASEKEYKEKLAGLQGLINIYAKKKINHVYVAKLKNDDGQYYLYGYWKEDVSIFLVDHFGEDLPKSQYNWLHNKARIDLKKDVVKTEEEMRGSTYLTTKAWADDKIKGCLSNGKLLVINKRHTTKR